MTHTKFHHLPFSLPKGKRSGFNLIEAAIVLGVVGLVIGGIWVAASAVQEKMRINQFRQDVFGVLQNAKKLIAIGAYTSETPASSAAVNMGLYPQSWIVNASLCYDWGFASCAGVVPPLGTAVGFRLNSDYVDMNIDFDSYATCQKAAYTLAQFNANGGGFDRMVVSYVADYTTFPITWQQAGTICGYNTFTIRANLTHH